MGFRAFRARTLTAFTGLVLFVAMATPVWAAVDNDNDGFISSDDCNDFDPQVWHFASETTNLTFGANKTSISWGLPADIGGAASTINYDTLRANYPYDFSCDLAVCTSTMTLPLASSDPTVPPSGQIFYYVSRARNHCGPGTIGNRSNGLRRPALAGTCTGLCTVSNGGFDRGLLGWILEGNCPSYSQLIQDDALHGNAFGLNFTGGSVCSDTKLWQATAVDANAQSSIRVRLDVKLMKYGGFYTGPVNVRIFTGIAPSYDQNLIGNHVFQPGAFAENSALVGTTSLPVGTWYAFTSDDIKPLLPPGTQFVRVELWVAGGSGTYGWGRVDNAKLILNDTAVPTTTATPVPATGHPPLLVNLTGTCQDPGGVCVGKMWDFGDGTTDYGSPGGGGTSTSSTPSYSFPASDTYDVSYTVEDDRGAARSAFTQVNPVNLPPTAAIGAVPGSGASPLSVQFTANTTDDHLIASYAWSFGDGGTSTSQNPLHIFAQPGTYNVSLTVTDDDGATASAQSAIIATGAQAIANGGFATAGPGGAAGWVLDGTCPTYSLLIADDALHGNAFGLNFTGGSVCSDTKLWQVGAVDVNAQSSVRVRVDVKLMKYGGFYTGPVNLRVFAGTTSPYDQTLIGNHVFQPGSFSQNNALVGTTTLPIGTWYAFTSDDIKPLIPPGTQFLRVELWVAGGSGTYGWGRVDNVKIVLNDAAIPTGAPNPNLVTGHPPLLVQFNGTCSDGDGSCASRAWDFGDGTTDYGTPGGGGSSAASAPSYSFLASRTYDVSYTVEDDKGAARSVFTQIIPVNLPPTAAIGAVPGSGASPLSVQFTANTTDDHLIASYAWSFGDGGTSASQNPLHLFAQPGTYDVTLTVTDDDGATAGARAAIVATGAQAIANGDFATAAPGGAAGWILEGNCPYYSLLIADDALHGNAFGLNFTGGGGCSDTKLWQVGAVDVNAQSSVRVRVDVKLMKYGGFYTGPVNLRVFAGTTSPYDQTLIGNHVFQPGSFSQNNALVGTTTLPIGTWYAFTSDDIKPLIPPGTQFLRVELWVAGASGTYGWGRVDNVKLVRNDAAAPVPTATASPTSGAAPLLVHFTGACSDGDGSCVATAWDFGDGTTDYGTAGGGSTSTLAAAAFTFTGNRTYNVSLSVEDDKGAARSTISSVSTINVPPTASIQAVPSSGPVPLNVQFTAIASDSDGTIVSYAWTFGDGATSSSANPAHVYTQTGTFAVTLSVTDDQGAFVTANYAIVVSP